MIVEQRGHRYRLRNRGGKGFQIIQYINKEPGFECDGVTQQEVLRMMLDRNRYCTACQPNSVSERIQYHLRMALVLHEMRALERKVQKGELAPEYVDIGKDDHFALNFETYMEVDEHNPITEVLKPYTPEWDRECNHHCGEPISLPAEAKAKSKPKDSVKRAVAVNDFKRIDMGTIVVSEIKKIFEGLPEIMMDRIQYYYGLARKRVNGRPLWKALKDDAYDWGMKATAYNEAVAEIGFKQLKASEFTPTRDVWGIGSNIRIINNATGHIITMADPEIYFTKKGGKNTKSLDKVTFTGMTINGNNDEESEHTFQTELVNLENNVVEIWSENGVLPS